MTMRMMYVRKMGCLVFGAALLSCSTDAELNQDVVLEEDPVAVLSPRELEFLEEYEYVTFNLAPDSFGADVNEKWTSDINVFLQGDLPDGYRADVEAVLEEFGNLIDNRLSFRIVDTREASNVHLVYGEKEAIRLLWPDMFNQIEDANFQGYALYRSANGFKIFDGRIWVRSPSLALFKHELGHVLGLGHGSTTYCDGDFLTNQSFMCSFLKEELSLFDKAILRTLYDPGIEAGKTFQELKPNIEVLLHLDVIRVE